MSILVVGLSPTLQRTLSFTELQKNEVNRARQCRVTAGGKGVNVARVLGQLNESVQLLTLLGGHTGQMVMDDLDNNTISYQAVSTESNTRICMTLLEDDNSVTELVEESEPVTETAVSDTKHFYESLLTNSELVILSGTIPAGYPETIYKYMTERASKSRIPVLVDGCGQLLRSALPEGPFLVKPNKVELEKTLSRKIESGEALLRAMKQLREEGAQNVLITDGTPQAVLLSDQGFFMVSAPKLITINPIGSGDAIAAGIAAGILNKKPLEDAVRYGMACGAANVLTDVAGNVETKEVENLYPQIMISEISV
jgi:1-phosphofructokinase family hexose kinase